MSTNPVDLHHHIEGGEYELSREQLGDSRFYRTASEEQRAKEKGLSQQPGEQQQQQQQPLQGEEGGQQGPPKLLEGGQGKAPEVVSSAAQPQQQEVDAAPTSN